MGTGCHSRSSQAWALPQPAQLRGAASGFGCDRSQPAPRAQPSRDGHRGREWLCGCVGTSPCLTVAPGMARQGCGEEPHQEHLRHIHLQTHHTPGDSPSPRRAAGQSTHRAPPHPAAPPQASALGPGAGTPPPGPATGKAPRAAPPASFPSCRPLLPGGWGARGPGRPGHPSPRHSTWAV